MSFLSDLKQENLYISNQSRITIKSGYVQIACFSLNLVFVIYLESEYLTFTNVFEIRISALNPCHAE